MNSRPFGIEVKNYQMGEDWVFLVTGGVAHIGAVATAYPVHDEIEVGLVTVPGHREDELAVEFATQICQKFNKTVTVVIGIHIDQATKKDIEIAVSSAREAVQEAISLICDMI